MYDIEWTVKAFRQVNKIKDQKIKTKIVDTVETFPQRRECGSFAKQRGVPPESGTRASDIWG